MNSYEIFGMLAQAETEGNPFLGLLLIGGIIWLLVAVFGDKKKDKYVVSNTTSVRKVK